MFARLGTWCHDRRRLVLVLWIVALIGVNMVAGAAGQGFKDDFNLPDVESREGFDILEERFGEQGTGQIGTIVFRAEQGVDDPEVRAAMERLFATADEAVTALYDDGEVSGGVTSPYEPGGERQIANAGPEAGKVAYADVELPQEVDFEDAGKVRDELLREMPDIDGLQVELGGFIFAEFEEPSSELLGLAFAIVILILAFGSVLAMGLPVGVALFGIGIGTALTTLLSHVLSVPDFATFLGIMIGLGVGIDYALLIVTRYREQLHRGHTVRESVAIALDTAGRAVLFAGTTVVISLLGMLVMGVAFVQGLSVAAATVVAITVAASMTLLPALLGFAGERVELTRWRGLVAAGLVAAGLVAFGFKVTGVGLAFVAAGLVVLVAGLFLPVLKREVPLRHHKPIRETAAYRWSRVIQHHPWVTALVGAAALLVLAIPVFGLRLGFSDESNYAEDTTTRQAYELLVDGFGEGFNGPLMLVAEVPEGVDQAALQAVGTAAEADPGVAAVFGPIPNDPEQPTAVLWRVIPNSGPQDETTTDTVSRLRDEVLPPAERAAGIETHLTGSVAVSIDFAHFLSGRLPYFFGAVLLLSFLLLMVVFRSLLVPLKAVIMNLLSIGAAYGVVVALFQWGWLSDITGVQPAPIEPWAPMMLFAIVFGLSMDYEVFLLSRIREEWLRTGDSHTSVADGLAATAKVISAAAAIMVVVFGAFILEDDRVMKLMGTGLAVSILLDATIVRMLLVPATMELLGDRNWWLPRWLDRLLPNIDVEGHAEPLSYTDDEFAAPDEELTPTH